MCQEHDSREVKKGKHITEVERYKIEGYKEARIPNREIARLLGKSHSAINKEIKRGAVLERTSELIEIKVYKADYAQMQTAKAAQNKGRGLKIGNDHKLVAFIEVKIRDQKFSPDATLAVARKQGGFTNMISTRMLYRYIDEGLFIGISNKDLPIKKDGKKRSYKRVRKVALNNKNGKSISERPETIEKREEKGHW